MTVEALAMMAPPPPYTASPNLIAKATATALPAYSPLSSQDVSTRKPSAATVQAALTGRGMAHAMTRDKAVARTSTGISDGTGMGWLFGKKSIELSISLSDNLVFIYPNIGVRQSGAEDNAGDEASSQVSKPPCLVVSLTLSIPANAVLPAGGIESLTVELMANESLGFPDAPFEYNTLTYAQKTLDEARDVVLEPGQTYHFQTLIEVPHHVTPFECNRYGRVLPRVRARLHWAGAKSRLFGGPRDLRAEQDVWVMGVPRTSNVLDYARTHQSFVEHLGPIILHARTQHLTVGGYLRLGLSLPAPALGCKIEKVLITLVQSTKLTSRSNSGHFTVCKPERIPFLSVEGEELQKCLRSSVDQQSGRALSGNWVARIPHDRYARPSTLEGSKDAALRITHQLEVRIVFVPPETVANKPVFPVAYSAAWPLTLASCACRWRSLKLPMYSEQDPLPVEDAAAVVADFQDKRARGGRRGHADACDQSICSCGIKLDELLRYECEQDRAQQTSTVRLMEQEIEAASTASPTSRRSSLEQTGSAEGQRQGSLTTLHAARSIDYEQPIDQREPTGRGPGGIPSWYGSEAAELERVRMEQKAAQEYGAGGQSGS